MTSHATLNISWTTIGTMVRWEVARGLREKEIARANFRGESLEAFHEYLKKIGVGTKEDCDRLRNFADGGDLDPSTIAKWQRYYDRPDSEKTDTIEACLYGGKWGESWTRLLLNLSEPQSSPVVQVYGFDLVQGRHLPLELIEEVRARIKGRKEMYVWGDLCSSDDCLQLMIDGDKWCALIGPNIQEGWAGFGDTRTEAVINMYKSMLNNND